jgi:hypothetical protein
MQEVRPSKQTKPPTYLFIVITFSKSNQDKTNQPRQYPSATRSSNLSGSRRVMNRCQSVCCGGEYLGAGTAARKSKNETAPYFLVSATKAASILRALCTSCVKGSQIHRVRNAGVVAARRWALQAARVRRISPFRTIRAPHGRDAG